MTHRPQKHTNANIDLRGKNNVDTIKRIMFERKTTLPSIRNQDWRTVKSETEKMNDLLTNIPTNDGLIYAGAKLDGEKIGVLLKTTDRKSKPGWEVRLESQMKRLQRARILKRNIKNIRTKLQKYVN